MCVCVCVCVCVWLFVGKIFLNLREITRKLLAPITRKLKVAISKDVKGPVSAVSHVHGFLTLSEGPKVMHPYPILFYIFVFVTLMLFFAAFALFLSSDVISPQFLLLSRLMTILVRV